MSAMILTNYVVLACSWLDFFVCFSSDEMLWQLIYISLSTFVAYHEKIYISFDEMSWQTIHISQFWLCSIFRFLFTCSNLVEMSAVTRISQFTIVFACWNRARCSTNHLARLLYLINICFEMFVIKVLDQKWFRTNDVFSIISFDFQYFRIDFKMRFTSKCSIKSCFARATFFLSLRNFL